MPFGRGEGEKGSLLYVHGIQSREGGKKGQKMMSEMHVAKGQMSEASGKGIITTVIESV